MKDMFSKLNNCGQVVYIIPKNFPAKPEFFYSIHSDNSCRGFFYLAPLWNYLHESHVFFFSFLLRSLGLYGIRADALQKKVKTRRDTSGARGSSSGSLARSGYG